MPGLLTDKIIQINRAEGNYTPCAFNFFGMGNDIWRETSMAIVLFNLFPDNRSNKWLPWGYSLGHKERWTDMHVCRNIGGPESHDWAGYQAVLQIILWSWRMKRLLSMKKMGNGWADIVHPPSLLYLWQISGNGRFL